MQEDLLVWQTFLASFNSISFWWQDLRLKAELQVQSSAAALLGFEVYFTLGFWSDKGISLLEALVYYKGLRGGYPGYLFHLVDGSPLMKHKFW